METQSPLKERILDFISSHGKTVIIRDMWNFVGGDYQGIYECLNELVEEGILKKILPPIIWEAGKTQYQIIE